MTGTKWTRDQLEDLGSREELVLVIARQGKTTLRVPVWPVVVGDDAYVRSYRGVSSGWFRSVTRNRDQAINLAEGDVAVHFESVPPTEAVNGPIGDEFLRKYATDDYRAAMITPVAVDATLRILPR